MGSRRSTTSAAHSRSSCAAITSTDPIGEISSAPDGTRYQFFGGARGMGAIYRINGTQAIYGPILQALAAQGYERGWLGYPSADAHPTSAVLEQQFIVDETAPDPVNQGLLRVRRLLRWNGVSPTATYDEDREYLVSPNSASSAPQDCGYVPVHYLEGSIGAQLYPQGYETLWCGPRPENAYNEDTSVDPSRI